MKTYYDILQVSPDAEQEVIEAAYRRLARKHHPDVNSGPGADKRMRELNEAYEVLGDPGRRATYDAELKGTEARAAAGAQKPHQRPRPPHPPSPPTAPPARPAASLSHEPHRRQTSWTGVVAGLLLAVAIAGTAAVMLIRSRESQTQAQPGAGLTAVAESTGTSAPTGTPAPWSAHAVWDYCRQIGTSPGYGRGDGMPDLAGTWVLRCYQGKPLMCACGATCGACMPLVYNETEPKGLADYCRENPDATFVPFYITGHAPGVYDWSCSNGEVTKKTIQIDLSAYDDLGYPRSSWQLVPEPQDKEEPVPPPSPNSTFAQPPPSGGFCDESYPDVCIPWADDPHYDCAHIPFRNFRVLLPDSKGYDPDGDGIGCEWP